MIFAKSSKSAADNSVPLRELAVFFLRMGATAFGGPAAHVAMMEQELVQRRGWLSREKFLDLLGASNLIPGPSTSELAIHIGYLCAGWAGLLIAGVCFILPAALMVAGLAWAYVHFGRLPAISWVLYGVKPVVIAVVVQALWSLGRTALKTPLLVAVALGAVAMAFYGVHPLLLLGVAGVMTVILKEGIRGRESVASSCLAPFAYSPQTSARLITAGSATVAAPFTLGPLFLVFLKAGAVVFGGGYVLLAFLRADLVVHRAWLTDSQLVDAIAIGQVTPGPVFTTATFIGYILGGFRGAVAATIGIFLPAFLLVAASGPLVPRIRESRIASTFLDGVNAASLALMAAVTWQLGRASITDILTAILAAGSLIILLRFRINSLWLLLAGAALGVMVHGLLHGI
ncbi:MAG TPA: chromate efflux transporter [Candidatus Angelobacter sp.]|nr:chromate efflux transporter [Candidatus Angelobacter sp.]